MQLNEVKLIGRIGSEPEFRDVGSSSVTSFSLAVNRSWQVDGEWKEETTWLRCEAWGITGGKLADLSKGTEIFVTGRIKVDEYEKDGVKKSQVKIVVEKFAKLEKAVKSEKSSKSPEELLDELTQEPTKDLINEVPF